MATSSGPTPEASRKQTPQCWKTFAVSVEGTQHQRKGIPCQDACRASGVASGWLVAVAADGAGSAAFGGNGARVVCDYLYEFLTRLIARGAISVDEVMQWPKLIPRVLLAARRRLEVEARKRGPPVSLADFDTTVVGALAGPWGGILFHIGDGAGCAVMGSDWRGAIVSPPENGQYEDETYFLTMEEWERHLRITPFGPERDTLLLLTDGGTSFIMAAQFAGPEPRFIAPVHQVLRQEEGPEVERELAALFHRPDVARVSGDDITFVWAHRS
ncbi:PP2C family serine/threonine-protein phosphatase [Archangium violaceum]|uniref:PP2C family serine/threonine-protein phosphatase n=1 Tax=Archangium violaceum TaxID=83451 RepID=UPI002B2A64AB|nr:PP2C family serine/threonine-protein phosphatase [Archangium gephyra]